eukprot:366444-Chlamydomonas_euryale.AAC.12
MQHQRSRVCMLGDMPKSAPVQPPSIIRARVQSCTPCNSDSESRVTGTGTTEGLPVLSAA